MPAKKRIFKEKPSMKTVKEGFKISDLLRVEVCNPLKEKIDKIKVCSPHLKESAGCLPQRVEDWDCAPWCCPPLRCFPECAPAYLEERILCCFPLRCFPECAPVYLEERILCCFPLRCFPERAPVYLEERILCCFPLRCFPERAPAERCKPDIICRPTPTKMCEPVARKVPKELPVEMREVFEKLEVIKAEIQKLRKAIK